MTPMSSTADGGAPRSSRYNSISPPDKSNGTDSNADQPTSPSPKTAWTPPRLQPRSTIGRPRSAAAAAEVHRRTPSNTADGVLRGSRARNRPFLGSRSGAQPSDWARSPWRRKCGPIGVKSRPARPVKQQNAAATGGLLCARLPGGLRGLCRSEEDAVCVYASSSHRQYGSTDTTWTKVELRQL